MQEEAPRSDVHLLCMGGGEGGGVPYDKRVQGGYYAISD
jgi:hypothetical protein